MKKLFPGIHELDYERKYQDAGAPEERHTRPGLPFDQTVKDVCEDCNNGWMHELEEQSRPILAPMIKDEARTLEVLDQFTVATWATKTVLVVGLTKLCGDQLVPSDSYRWLACRRMPLPGSVVWLARYEGKGQWPISFHQHGIAMYKKDEIAQQAAETNGLHAVFAVGHLALCVFVADLPEGPVFKGNSSQDRMVIWPNASEKGICWPPPTSFATDTELRDQSMVTPDGIASAFPGPELS